MRHLSLIIALAMISVLAGCAGTFHYEHITGELLRGSRPTCEDLKTLRDKEGVRSDISLENSKGVVEKEKACAHSLGLEFRSVPMSNWTRPTQAQVGEALADIHVLPKRVFVHCLHGHDRTGVTVAAYRMTEQGWPEDLAYREMVAMGHAAWLYDHWPLNWQKSLDEVKP